MTTTSTSAQPTRSRPATVRPSHSVWSAGLAAAGVAAAANLAVYAIARAAGAPLRVRFSTHQAAWPIAAGDVLAATLVALGLGTAVAALWLRRRNHGLAAAQVIGAVVALVSLSIPLAVHADPGTKAALASMHLIAGMAFVAAMGRARSASRGHAMSGDDPDRAAGYGEAA